MSKHKRKRFLSILITAVLVFTLALSSVMAQDDEHVRTDKLSVEGESVEVIEGVTGEDDANVVADDAITADDAETEETDAEETAEEAEEELPAGEVTEEAVADVPEAAEDDAEADAGIMTLSVGDIEDDESEIMPLADTTVASGLQNAIDAASSGDTITLGGNITESVTVASGQNITLDLNGYTLNGGGSTVITVEGTLTLKDSSSAGVYVESATFTMTGGTISGNTASQVYGGGVFVENKSGGESTFTMSGGTISDNSASYGAGVAVNEATLNLSSNALITNNAASTTTSGGGGGNVYLYGSDAAELNMTGGTISYGSAYSGGGVNVAAGTVNMSGGTITKNTVKDTGHYAGGGVCLSGDYASFTMSGGTISENDGFSGGGGVAASGGTFTMSGGSIENNTAIYGGGVDAEYTTITMTGGSITGNTARDGSVEGNARSAAGGGVYISNNSAGFTVSGGAVTGNAREDGTVDNVYISNGKYITLGTDLSTVPATVAASGASNQIGVTTANEPTESTPVRFTDVENGTEYYATSASYFFSDQGYGVRSNEGAYLELYLMDFEEQYLTGDDGELYTAATADNYKQILSGASDWDAMDSDEQEKINDDLTAAWQAAGNTGTLTYEDLLEQAQAIADEVNAFEESYLGGADSLYTEATAENYQEILAGTSDWDAMSDEAKAAVNADLTAAWQAAGNEGELTYEDLLAQAQAVADANEFEESYLGGASSLYTEATADNYQEILAGASDWANMSDEAKAQVNADLTAAWQAAGNEGELTYDDLLAQAFELAYLTDDSGNGPYTEVTADNIDQILFGADDWALMSDEAKAAVNAALQDASGDSSLTYDGLLAQAFEQKYLMADGDGNLYTEATADNYRQILAGASDWDSLSPEAQAQINADLTAANGGEELTYPMLLEWAKALAAELEGTGNVKTGDSTRLYLYGILAAAAAAAAAGAAVSRRRRI